MKRYTLSGLFAVLLLFAAGCADLAVENLNEPDAERAVATPADVEGIVGGTFLTWWDAIQGSWFTAHPLAVAADQMTSSWGNFAMKDMGSEPRAQWNNNSTYGYAYVTEGLWYQLYSTISASNDAINAIDGGVVIENAERTAVVKTAAHLMQGMSLAYLALDFDRAFIVDEKTDVGALTFPENANYKEVADAAIAAFQKAIAEADKMGSQAFPSSYINGYDESNKMDKTKVKQLANSFIARMLVYRSRTPQENAQTDWAKVLQHARAGLQGWNFSPTGNGVYGQWSDMYKEYGERPGWVHADLELMGLGDPAKLAAWKAVPVTSQGSTAREPFLIDTADRRLTGAGGPTTNGKYTTYEKAIPFRGDRGTYHFSNYRWTRYAYHIGVRTGPMPQMLEDEIKYFIAEALLRTGGSKQEAVDIINSTRVKNGELAPVTTAATKDQLLEALMYERLIELGWTGHGIAFYDKRRFDIPGPSGVMQLKAGTPRHYPVPGKELEVLQKTLYTFGGDASGKSSFKLIQTRPSLKFE